MKKTLIITGIIVAIIGIGAGIYFGWKKKIFMPLSSPGQLIKNQNSSFGAVPKLRALSNEEVVTYWADSTYDNIFYLSSKGKIFKTNQEGEEVISEEVLGDVKSGEFSADGKLILAEISSLGFTKWNIFDLENKNWIILPTTITSISFSSDGKKVAYLQNNINALSDLFTNDAETIKKPANEFLKRQTKIISLNQEGFKVGWLDDKILLISEPSIEADSDIWMVDLKTKTISKLLSARALMANWFKFGDLGLVFDIKGNTPRLSLFNSLGKRLAEFGFYTLPQKCFASNQTDFFCAIPSDQEAFSQIKFIDSYFKRGNFTKDNIARIDLSSSKMEFLFNSNEQVIDATKISFSGDRFLFINRYDNRLYSLAL